MKKLYPKEYKAWCQMRRRCTNPKDQKWHRYGARGIMFCQRWVSFKFFIEDMGPRPTPKHTLDRVDNDGNYEKANCRWATPKQQARNRSATNYHFFKGRKRCLAEISEITGVPLGLIEQRMRRDGMSLKQAISKPRTCRGALYEFEGKQLSLDEICKITGMRYGLVHQRIHRDGLPLEKALAPPDKRNLRKLLDILKSNI